MLIGLNDRRLPPDFDVVIAGLGPVGATAALTLARVGLRVAVFEEAPADGAPGQDATGSRASTFHPPTLEILDALGVAGDLHDVGLICDSYQYRDRAEGLVAHFDLAEIKDDTPFPYRLQSEQQNLVRIITDRLAGMPHVHVVHGARVASVEQDGDTAAIRIETAGNAVRGDAAAGSAATAGDAAVTVRARWVIAADGAHSTVRRELGIAFEGMTYPEQFLVVSTSDDFAALIPGLAHVNYISDPREWVVLLRTPLHWRALFPLPPDETGDALEPAAIQRRLQAVAPKADDYTITNTRLYRVHQRVAERLRDGRVLLAGDAAHINNPLGGMGMNSGIHDASAAAAAILAAEAGDRTPMDRYNEERRGVALDYVRVVTHGNREALQEQDPAERRRRHEEMRRTAADPGLARAYLLRSSMLAARVPEAARQPG